MGIIAIALVLCIASILFYSEYETKNFMDEFFTNSDRFEETVYRISIWEMNGGVDNKSILNVNKDEELYSEVCNILIIGR